MNGFRRCMLPGVALIGTTAPAFAGGFRRGQADTDLLCEPGRVSSRASLGYIATDRGFRTIGGVAGDHGGHTGNRRVPRWR